MERRIRILIVSPMCPVPAVDGGRIRISSIAAGLARRGHAVEVVALVGDGDDPRAARDELAANGVVLTAVPHRAGRAGAAAAALLRGRSLHTSLVAAPGLWSAVAPRLGDIDVLQCEYAYTGWLLRRAAGRAPRPLLVLDQHNVEHRLAGVGAGNGALSRAYTARERRTRRSEERRACAAADLVLAVSDEDREILRGMSPGTRFATIPNGVDLDRYPFRAAAADRRGIVFVGKVDYGPNVDGVVWFARQILPLIRARMPEATLTVVGGAPAPAVRDLAAIPGVAVTGFVPDTRPYLDDAAVAVVPLRAGSGTRLKVLEAMAAGLPVVATTLGAAGIAAPAGSLLREDTPDRFAAAVVTLLGDPSERERVAAAARAAVEDGYGWDAIVERLEAAYG